MPDLIHADLSYRVIGACFKVYNTIGPGFQEKYYQRAVAKVFEKEKIPFLEQVKVDMRIDEIKIGRYFIDFVVDHRMVLEIKAKNFFSIKDIKQVLGYLKRSGIEVGLLIAFSTEGIKIKRILKGNNQGTPEKSVKDSRENYPRNPEKITICDKISEK